VTRRRTGVLGALAAVILLAGCGGDPSAGGSPTPFEDDATGASSTSPPGSDPATPATTATPTVEPTGPPAKRQLVIVAPGRFVTSPAVGGFTQAIQVFFRARMTYSPDLMQGWATSKFRADNDIEIINAKPAGYVMRAPGRVVVRGVSKGPIQNTTTVDVCLGPTMAWFDPKKKRYTNDLPNGSPISFVMYGSGPRWLLHVAVPGKFSCATAKYPRG
jgi:hypothetical protein